MSKPRYMELYTYPFLSYSMLHGKYSHINWWIVEGMMALQISAR
jgi:hypothetical protein